MTRRIIAQSLPDPPQSWDSSSQDAWRRLIQILEASELFDKSRRERPAFIVEGTVSAPVTLDINNPEVTVLAHILGKLLLALQTSKFVDVRP
jgi:hypothetical protein